MARAIDRASRNVCGGGCVLFDNGPRLLVADNPAIENPDRITIEAWG